MAFGHRLAGVTHFFLGGGGDKNFLFFIFFRWKKNLGEGVNFFRSKKIWAKKSYFKAKKK